MSRPTIREWLLAISACPGRISELDNRLRAWARTLTEVGVKTETNRLMLEEMETRLEALENK